MPTELADGRKESTAGVICQNPMRHSRAHVPEPVETTPVRPKGPRRVGPVAYAGNFDPAFAARSIGGAAPPANRWGFPDRQRRPPPRRTTRTVLRTDHRTRTRRRMMSARMALAMS